MSQNLEDESDHVKKIGTFRLLLPPEHTRLRLNLNLLQLTGSANLFSKIADDIYQKLIFPIKIPEIYKSGSVLRYVARFQKFAQLSDQRVDPKMRKKLDELVDNCVLQKVESRKNSYNLYRKSYESIKDSYSLYSMAFMEERGLGVQPDNNSAIRRYREVLTSGFRKLIGSRKYIDGEYKREGFAEIVSAGSGLIKLYFKRLISYIF